MEIEDVVLKLSGPIEPVGESRVDEIRLSNIKTLTGVVDSLLYQIHCASKYVDRHEASMKAIGIHAQGFLKYISDEFLTKEETIHGVKAVI